MVVGACIGGAMTVGITAGIDIWNGEISSTDEYKFAGLSDVITGEISPWYTVCFANILNGNCFYFTI